MKKRKGSLTVEAVISVTVFLGMTFLLLNAVKIVLYMTILNNAATETAKNIAVLGYPFSFLNEAQESLESKEDYLSANTLTDSLKSGGGGAVLSSMLGGDPKSALKGNATDLVKNLVGGVAVRYTKGAVYQIKGSAVKGLGGLLVQQYLDNTGLVFDKDRVLLRMIKIPVTKGEFETVYAGEHSLSEDGSFVINASGSATGMDGDFNAEDVVVCLEYPCRIAVPLLPTIELTLRSTAVEHGWLSGTCAGPKRTEGIAVNNLIFGSNKTVYVATGGYGKRYHTANCKTLWDSKQAITLEAAKKDGFTACRVCKPDEQDK